MTSSKCFIEILVIAGTGSGIVAQIDPKGPHWTFLALGIIFRVIPDILYFIIGLVSLYRSYMMQYNWSLLRYY